MWFTPIIWNLDMMVENPILTIVFKCSPFTYLVEGFRQAFQVQGGTGYRYFANKSYQPAGKTGTADVPVFENGVKYDTINRSVVAYAPTNDPEIAIAVMVPNITSGANEDGNAALIIGERIFDTYFDMESNSSSDEDDE